MNGLATLVLKSPDSFDLCLCSSYFTFQYKGEFPSTEEHLGKGEGFREDFLCQLDISSL